MAMTEKKFAGSSRRFTEKGMDNLEFIATMPAVTSHSKNPFRIFFVTCSYSTAPTQTGVTFDLKSGAGAEWNTLKFKGAANSKDTVYYPSGDLKIADDDGFKVTAPPGGVGEIAAIAIYGGYVE